MITELIKLHEFAEQQLETLIAVELDWARQRERANLARSQNYRISAEDLKKAIGNKRFHLSHVRDMTKFFESRLAPVRFDEVSKEFVVTIDLTRVAFTPNQSKAFNKIFEEERLS